ncbi:MAG: hypothetical protein V3V28_00155 [Polaribacter sp.]|uniref:hypothetical protein n=1 Tax=Polaribacter sp. TaxID=1920175 RepID=UPI002F35FA52
MGEARNFMMLLLICITAVTSAQESFDLNDLNNWVSGVDKEAKEVILKDGESIYSENKIYKLTMQADSNLCFYKNDTEFIWCSMSNGYGKNAYMKLKGGNFAVYDANNKLIWKPSSITGNPTNIILGNDGVLKLEDSNKKVLWTHNESHTNDIKDLSGYKGDYVLDSKEGANCNNFNDKSYKVILDPNNKQVFYLETKNTQGFNSQIAFQLVSPTQLQAVGGNGSALFTGGFCEIRNDKELVFVVDISGNSEIDCTFSLKRKKNFID